MTVFLRFLVLSPLVFNTMSFSVTQQPNKPTTSGSPRPAGAHRPIKQAAVSCRLAARTISSNEELIPGIEAINEGNDDLHQKLEDLRDTPYFRFYSVDILASCEYIPQELFECYTESCEIYPVEEDEVPEAIREVDHDEHDFEIDGWARWDMPSDDYYDTQAFPEGYTGYDGSDVWKFIHKRICFDDFDYNDDHWKADYNKAVSGLHSMISAQIVRGIKEKKESGEAFSDDEIWRDPEKEFQRRLSPQGETPSALENLYFSFMLLLTAAKKVKSRLLEDCDSEKIDNNAAKILKDVLSSPLLEESSVDVASKRLHDHAIKDSASIENLWEARMRTRDLFRIMNCVQCNKCRLHGKISIMGLSTALQILLGNKGEGGEIERIHRVELATLMTSLDKFSRAIKFCREMRS